MALIKWTDRGLYCPEGDFYIDPWKKVNKALITHGHSDHARRGMTQYICTEPCVPILKARLGNITVSGIRFGEKLLINGVHVSFHPAGHVFGSAQIKVSKKGETWVISGDYKTENDGISGHFEPIECHHFVTETTFGLPLFNWPKQESTYRDINEWWSINRSIGRPCQIGAYSLGKAQRLLKHLDRNIGPVYVTPTIDKMNRAYKMGGADPGPYAVLDEADQEDLVGAIVVGGTNQILDKLSPARATASGWNQVKRTSRVGKGHRKFVLSDHADWSGLLTTIEATGAESIYVTHGYESAMAKWIGEQGLRAVMLSTEYGDES